MSVLLDTHIWIWWLTGQDDLSPKRLKQLDRMAREGKPPNLSAISLWETQMLVRKNRLRLTIDFPDWLVRATDPAVVRILPLDASVILALHALPETFHGDPADRIIVSTARAFNLPLMTADQSIRRSRAVKVL